MAASKGPTEASIQKAILQYLKAARCLAWRNNSGAMTGEYKGKRRFVRFNTAAGGSDLFCLLPDGSGRFASIEVKRPGNAATEKQSAWLESVRAAGGVAFVATSVEDVRRELMALGCKVP